MYNSNFFSNNASSDDIPPSSDLIYDDLPMDIKNHIISFLDDKSVIRVMTFINHEFYSIIDELKAADRKESFQPIQNEKLIALAKHALTNEIIDQFSESAFEEQVFQKEKAKHHYITNNHAFGHPHFRRHLYLHAIEEKEVESFLKILPYKTALRYLNYNEHAQRSYSQLLDSINRNYFDYETQQLFIQGKQAASIAKKAKMLVVNILKISLTALIFLTIIQLLLKYTIGNESTEIFSGLIPFFSVPITLFGMITQSKIRNASINHIKENMEQKVAETANSIDIQPIINAFASRFNEQPAQIESSTLEVEDFNNNLPMNNTLRHR